MEKQILAAMFTNLALHDVLLHYSAIVTEKVQQKFFNIPFPGDFRE
jgi:hypothetical protein